MKRILVPILILATIVGCSTDNNPPKTGTLWGEIQNASFEKVSSSEVKEWVADLGNHVGFHIYDHLAKNGDKSITIHSTQPKSGRWYTKVNVKPWSVYEFSGWIKTDQLVTDGGDGAGFNMGAHNRQFEHLTEPVFLSGDNDWREISYQFNTGNQDCVVIECLFNRGGRASGQVWFDDLKLQLLKTETLAPEIKIDVAEEKEVMQDYVYGQFIEHLGRCIYGGIWAEVLEDRKFFYEPNHRESPWKVVPQEALMIDQTHSFVGDITPILTTTTDQMVVLMQDGLGIRESTSYSGRIVLKAMDIHEVRVTLKWGTEDNEKDIVSIITPGNEYKTYELLFEETEDCSSASLMIEPIGTGKLWIGTVSIMPDDNIEGFREDVLGLLQELNSPVYRWPGGNFVSGYDWKDGIGDPDRRPPRKNPAWTGVEHNDVGMHEFIRFCELLETEPYIAVNAGLGGTEEARKQVEYCNGSSDTPMGKWRSQNGSEGAWKVKWWSVGNEMYGGWQLGYMSTEKFVQKHNDFAKAMRSVDQDIILVAVGDLGKWDEMMLTHCSDHMDYISEHFYRQDWHGGGLMTHIQQIPEAIRQKAVGHRKYREEIAGLAEKDIRICLDEWNYWYGPHIYGELGTRYFMRDALGVAAGINEFSRQSDMIYMANYAQTVNVIGAIKATTTDAVMASTGQALTMYRKYFGSIPVTLSGDNRPLDIAATITKDRTYLTVSLVNLGWDSHGVPLEFEGPDQFSEVEVITLSAASDMAYNVPGQAETVTISEPEIIGFNGSLEIKPVEARIYRFKLK